MASLPVDARAHLANGFAPFQNHVPRSHPNGFVGVLDPNLQALESTGYPQAFAAPPGQQPAMPGAPQLQQQHAAHQLVVNGGYAPRFAEIRTHAGEFRVPSQVQQQPVPPQTPHQPIPQPAAGSQSSPPQSHGQFGILTLNSQIPRHLQAHIQTPTQPSDQNAQEQDDGEADGEQNGEPGNKRDGQLPEMYFISDPPSLAEWREKLFDVDGVLQLTEAEFKTYFPHVDNVYSHRSTQRYKRKPFISHYWDCRLKGRPSGTPKSDDPNKKKRKRVARERDLCDVKIKITEYFPGARALIAREGDAEHPDGYYPPEAPVAVRHMQNGQNPLHIPSHLPGANGERYYTIQRVNGNGNNGKGDGIAGPHKHTLEESDRIKKNSIHRRLHADEKTKKTTQKTYHKKASGVALSTVKRHAREHELKLFGSCFCPFVQRVWIALELKDMPYQYVEVDPYKKPLQLLEVNPRGLVPALRHGNWGCHESTVLLDYLEDIHPELPLLPLDDPQKRAFCRLWADHINRSVVPAFYHYLQAQEPQKQVDGAKELQEQLQKLVDAADPTGPFFLGPKMTWVDVQVAPWMLRMSRVLKPYRSWPDPPEGSRLKRWVDALESDVDVRATTSNDDLYLDSYERYAENRPNTSQVANAVNAGRGLP